MCVDVGTRGASIDEFIEEGVNGELVPAGDRESLASALVRAWEGTARWGMRPVPASALMRQMERQIAVSNFMRLAGVEMPQAAEGLEAGV